MPDVCRLGRDGLLRACEQAVSLGIPTIALFPSVDSDLKDKLGGEALNPDEEQCINGLMKARQVLQAPERKQLEELIAQAHLKVFGMIRQERSLDRARWMGRTLTGLPGRGSDALR